MRTPSRVAVQVHFYRERSKPPGSLKASGVNTAKQVQPASSSLLASGLDGVNELGLAPCDDE